MPAVPRKADISGIESHRVIQRQLLQPGNWHFCLGLYDARPLAAPGSSLPRLWGGHPTTLNNCSRWPLGRHTQADCHQAVVGQGARRWPEGRLYECCGRTAPLRRVQDSPATVSLPLNFSVPPRNGIANQKHPSSLPFTLEQNTGTVAQRCQDLGTKDNPSSSISQVGMAPRNLWLAENCSRVG